MSDTLNSIIEALAQTQWAAVVLDGEDRLQWLSDEMKYFMRETDDAKLGLGLHYVSALTSDAWLATVTDAGRARLFEEALPYLVESYRRDPEAKPLPEPFGDLLPLVQGARSPEVWTGTFEYQPENGPTYDVRYIVLRIREESGEPLATVVITMMSLPARLLAQLAGGDFVMQARMAELADPGRHAAAIVFVDLQGSAALSRRLPTAAYFDVIRRVTCEFDRLTASAGGLVGKHVGDGMTAFLLPEHTGSPAAAAEAALELVRTLQRDVEDIAAELDTGELRLNAGLHWGPGIYLGQLVPGGRLEITAIGDEVNQAARIQECARDGRILASKAFVELLAEPPVARPLYEQLQDLPSATPKAIADAGQIAVTAL